MLAEQHDAIFLTVTGVVGAVTVVRAVGERKLGDGLSTRIAVGENLIKVAYWRLMREGIARVSSIEDGQRLSGLPIDAAAELEAAVVGRDCLGLLVDPATGDLLITFTGDAQLRAFRFRSLFEDWEVRLPDGEAYWSNMVDLQR